MRTKLKGYRLIEFKRPITHVKYNLDCDLFLASSKAKNIYSWRGDAFEPLNSYEGHKGSINDFCIQDDSKLIISASADNSLMIFDTETAAVINKLTEKGPFTHCGISLSRQMFFYIYVSGIDSYSLNVRELNGDITLIFQKEGKGLPTCAMWGYLDEQIIIGLENGQLIIFDLCTKNIKPIQAHKSSISDIQMSRDYMHFITCSTDSTVLFWDASTYNYNKYETNVNLNSVSLSPFKDYVFIFVSISLFVLAGFPRVRLHKQKQTQPIFSSMIY
uniref:Serine-threonine kinase receptor-associated protein n=1 Tax=Henneguya salminicola TaxID=69463 RepID=A0A6G3MGL9_HENSL